MLRAEQLSRIVLGKTLVESVSFTVERGEILAVAGPSGSGKTSLLRLLNRLDEPTSGTVYLDGLDVREIPTRTLRRRVGMLMQAAFLFPGTAADNVRYGPRQQGIELDDAAVSALMARVGLAGMERTEAAHFSGGEAQRLSLARVLANNPEVLLLDEPTSALDAAARTGIETLIEGIVREEQAACVWITHDRAQAMRIARRALILRAGRVLRSGATEEVMDAEGNLG